VELENHEIDAFDGIVPPVPFTLTLESSGALGHPNFRYHYRFHSGARAIYPRRIGCFLQHDGRVYRLDASLFALLEAIDSFNAEPPERKIGGTAFIRFEKVKGLASAVGAQLDRFIAREKVLIASRVGLDLVLDPDGRISFAPKVDGAPDEPLRRAFFAADDAEEMYRIDDGEGGRMRIILDDEQREVLRRMQRVRHLGGAERAEVLRKPVALFDGVANHVDIDLEQFGPRVKGIGDFPFTVQPYVRLTGECIFDAADPAAGAAPSPGIAEAGLECRYADGSATTIVFTNPEQARQLRDEARQAWLAGHGVIEYEGKSIALDETLIRALDEQVAALNPSAAASDGARAPRRYLLIHTNEAAVEYSERADDSHASLDDCELPRSLRPERPLKEHQREGLAWLQRCFRMGRCGCLLADDMGLGKTLQMLCFLAWMIERGELSPGSADGERPPWDPILVVMPLVLLENEVWQKDVREFFANEGAIFQPWLALHGPELAKIRRVEGRGASETLAGLPLLDVEALRNYRLIMTNYETITNYQFSFARIDVNWSVVVADEAQAFKTPNTKISHALKGMSPRFRVACTGTPVETRLRDVWNIFDYLQPGYLLASESEFIREIEQPYQASNEHSGNDSALASLRAKFKIGRPEAWLMRRDKRQRLPGLPEKVEHQIKAPLSDEQRRMHLEVMRLAGQRAAHPFELLNQLMSIYQHPALTRPVQELSADDALAQCPKLAAVIDRLREIRARGEKALIFVYRKPMQRILAQVIGDRFGLRVDIINGEHAGGDQSRARASRRQMIERFRAHPGFDVLVLSPVVAGLGLTLVEANHVIHYGRWWNPAREAQATDRVYRIGQTRPVHVYYPIAIDPRNEFVTFDEKLDRIIERRRQMAQDFLAPLPAEQEIQQELLDEVLPHRAP
ncbi:MAG: DEAD/DEAH box helicase, partial [Candidatus Binataceae bacterium]